MLGLIKTIRIVLFVVIFAALLGLCKRTGIVWPVFVEIAYLAAYVFYNHWKYGVLKSEEWMDEH